MVGRRGKGWGGGVRGGEEGQGVGRRGKRWGGGKGWGGGVMVGRRGNGGEEGK